MAEKPAKLAVTNGKHFVGAMSRLSVKRNQISSFRAIRYEGRVAKNEIQIRCQRYRRLRYRLIQFIHEGVAEDNIDEGIEKETRERRI